MFDSVIGLEIHVQLATESKLFCGCSTKFTAEENLNICPVCTGHLGALPVLNERALDYAVKAALALNCRINNFSMFDRKNYFYPDLPKGYQITQFYHPYAEYGFLDISNKRVTIRRIHVEEDAGKLIHDEFTKSSYVDFNRSSVPLIEIVTNPDLSTSQEVYEFLTKLRTTLKYTGVSDVSMELGSLRCDANVSIKPKGSETLGTRVEIKNLNSFKSVVKAIDYEVERQKSVLDECGVIRCETRLWDEARMVTRCMREKESADDYRYFPDPDLPTIELSDMRINFIRESLPELPEQKRERFIQQYQIPEYDADVLTSELELANYFENVVIHCLNAKAASNWIMTEVLRTKDKVVPAQHLGKMIKMIDDNIINGKIGKEIFQIMVDNPKDPMQIVEENGLIQISNVDEINEIVESILQKNPKSIEEYKAGMTKVLGFLVGQVMKESKGRANPALVNKLIIEKIS